MPLPLMIFSTLVDMLALLFGIHTLIISKIYQLLHCLQIQSKNSPLFCCEHF